MSKLEIKYMDNSRNRRDITGIDISVKNDFLQIQIANDEIHYIPLCNIKEIGIKGANQIRGE